jgi:hypothetical protein
VEPVLASPEALPEAWPVLELWLVVASCVVEADELMSVDCWFAATLLDTDWSPLPTFTPGLMFAAAFTSALLTPTFASTPTLGFTFTPVAEPVVEDWSVEALCDALDDELMSVELWFALTLLDTDWSPPCPLRSTLIPGLTLAPRFTSLLPRFTLASTPTFGLAFTLVPLLPPAIAGSVADEVALDCVLDAL